MTKIYANLRTNQGPLADRFSPPNPHLAVVTEIIEINGQPMTQSLFNEFSRGDENIVHVMHWADWGDVHRVFDVIGKLLTPDTSAVIRIMRKEDGEVLHVLYINTDPPAPPAEERLLAAMQRLLHDSWKDIGFTYAGLTNTERSLVSPEEFETLADWVKKLEP